MKFKSVRYELIVILSLMIIAFATILFNILDSRLTKIVDTSQDQIYYEKIQKIVHELKEADSVCNASYLPLENAIAYQNAVVTRLSNVYYTTRSDVFPFIVNDKQQYVMHPTKNIGSDVSIDYDTFNLIVTEGGKANSFLYFSKEDNGNKWFIYEYFPQWKWFVVYSVPTDIKYRDVTLFKYEYVKYTAILIIVIIFFLFVFFSKFTTSIRTLSKASSKLAMGYLDEDDVVINRFDEIGTLSKNFNIMKNAINRQILDLKEEIAERKKAEDALHKLQRITNGIIDAIPSMIIGVDEHGMIIYWNSTCEREAKLAYHDVFGKKVEDVLQSFSFTKDMFMQPILNDEDKIYSKYKCETYERIEYFDIAIYHLGDKSKNGAVIIIDNVSDQVLMETEFCKGAKWDAIACMSQSLVEDFTIMLNDVIHTAKSLQEQDLTDDNAVDTHAKNTKTLSFEKIIKSANIAKKLSGQLVQFGNQSEISYKNEDLHELLEDAISLLKRVNKENVSLSCKFNAVKTTAYVDASLIENTIFSCGVNSINAINGVGEINVSTKNVTLNDVYCNMSPYDITPGEFICIGIEDNGSGINPEKLQKIFNPFSATKSDSRIGFSLSHIQSIVESHKGAIEIFSEVGRGSVVTIYLPVIGDESGHTIKAVKQKVNGTILVVDDDSFVRMVTKDILEDAGYNVVDVENAEDAIDLFKMDSTYIDLVIIDNIMPGVNGIETFERINNMNPDIKMVMTSGFSISNDILDLKEYGLVGFIKKPYNREKLCRTVRQVLNGEVCFEV